MHPAYEERLHRGAVLPVEDLEKVGITTDERDLVVSDLIHNRSSARTPRALHPRGNQIYGLVKLAIVRSGSQNAFIDFTRPSSSTM